MANTNVVTGTVRLSYLNVFKPKASVEGGEAKYSVCLLIPKSDTKTLQNIKEACEAARTTSAGKFNGKIPERLKLPIHDGDGEMPNGGEYAPECKGHYVLNASAKMQPVVVDRTAQPILDQTTLYSGCYGRVSLNFYAYNTNGNKGIAAGLNGVQKVRDGEPLGASARNDFTAIEDDDDLGI